MNVPLLCKIRGGLTVMYHRFDVDVMASCICVSDNSGWSAGEDKVGVPRV